MSASTIIKFGTLQDRARQTKCKLEIVSGLFNQSYKKFYAVGPTSVRNFESHIEKCEAEENGFDNCKVFTYETMSEVEAHLNAVEFCVKMASP